MHNDDSDSAPESVEPAQPVPKGLVLFAPDASRSYRRRRLMYSVLFVAITLALVWPIYPLFAGPEPLILGLPLPLVWILLCMTVNFAAMLGLYRREPNDAPATSANTSPAADAAAAADGRAP